MLELDATMKYFQIVTEKINLSEDEMFCLISYSPIKDLDKESLDSGINKFVKYAKQNEPSLINELYSEVKNKNNLTKDFEKVKYWLFHNNFIER